MIISIQNQGMPAERQPYLRLGKMGSPSSEAEVVKCYLESHVFCM